MGTVVGLGISWPKVLIVDGSWKVVMGDFMTSCSITMRIDDLDLDEPWFGGVP